jgi:iron complex outermembrane receptor protein
MARYAPLLALAALCAASPAAAQRTGEVAGRVIDADDGSPVATAAVRALGTVTTAFADDSGRFVLRRVPAGPRRVLAERIGYNPREVGVEVIAGERVEIEIALEASAVALAEVVVAATRHAQSAMESPVSVSILDEEQVMLRVPDTAADAVAYAPSVQFVGENINIRGSSGYSRGTGSRVLLLIDGAPSNAGDSGAINWDLIPLTEVTRIEVIKGAGSALYGTSALGGVVNIVTAGPPRDATARVRLRGGFYDDPPFSDWIWSNQTLGFGSVEASYGQWLGPFGFWVRGGRWIDDGYRINSDLERTNVAFDFRLGGAADTLALSGTWAREDYGAALLWCMRGECEDTGQLAFQPLRVAFSAEDDRTRSDKGRLNLTHRRRWGRRLNSFLRLSYQQNDWKSDFGDELLGSVADSYGGELRFDWEPAAWLFLTLGADAGYDDVDANLFGKHDMSDIAAYFQGEFSIGSWLTLTAGLREDAVRVDGASYSDQLSPRVGLVLAPDPRTRVRASVGKGFRAPSIAEFFTSTQVGGFLVTPNDSLRPETSLAGEVGIKRLVSSWLSLDVAGFIYDFDDLIVADTTIDRVQATIDIQFQNKPEARVAGVEVDARLSFFRDKLQGGVAYTYLHSEDKATGEPLPYRPANLVTATGTLFLGGLELGADYRFASAFEAVQVFTDPRTDPLVPMNVLDLRLAYRFGRQTIRFIVDNSTNYAYTTIERNMEPIRRYTAALELEF